MKSLNLKQNHVRISNREFHPLMKTNGKIMNKKLFTAFNKGRDSAFGITNRYALDGPGIESQWGEIVRPDQL
jgi:hypothetical protein